jgi:uncharacterized protein with PIN domain
MVWSYFFRCPHCNRDAWVEQCDSVCHDVQIAIDITESNRFLLAEPSPAGERFDSSFWRCGKCKKRIANTEIEAVNLVLRSHNAAAEDLMTARR